MSMMAARISDDDAVARREYFAGTPKQCKTCRDVKERSEFYAHNTNIDGLFSDCKKCLLKKRRDRYKEQRERNCAHLSRVQKFVQGYYDPSELTDDEVLGSYIVDDDGAKVDTAELRERFQSKFNKEVMRRVNDVLRSNTVEMVKIMADMAKSDFVEPADRIKAATWVAERFIGKIPDVVFHGKTDKPYESVFEALESGSREDYRKSRADIIDAEVLPEDHSEFDEDSRRGESSETTESDELDGSGTGEDARRSGGSSVDGESSTGFAATSENGVDGRTVLGTGGAGSEIETKDPIQEAKAIKERIKKARNRRFAARAIGATTLSDMPYVITFRRRKDGTFTARLCEPDEITEAKAAKIVAGQQGR